MSRSGNPHPSTQVRFSSTYQPANRGRKPSLFRKLKDAGVSREDIYKLFKAILFGDKEEAEKMINDPKVPLIAVTYLRGLMADLKDGKTDVAEQMLDRLYGRPKQQAEISSTSLGVTIEVSGAETARKLSEILNNTSAPSDAATGAAMGKGGGIIDEQ